jgi:hypothetical protein
MTRAERNIYSFLDNHLGLYDNPHGLEFCMNIDDSVFVVHPLSPPEPWIDFGLLYPSAPFLTFMRDFRFKNSHDLVSLTPARLWAMYRQGQAEIYCTIVVKIIFHALYFRLTENNKMIVRDDHDNEHEIGEVLTSPNQFLEYTQNHFLLNEG